MKKDKSNASDKMPFFMKKKAKKGDKEVKAYAAGGQVSRGHGAAVKGFKFTKNG